MKKMMTIGAASALVCAIFVGCAGSTKLTPEQEAAVGPWREQAQMMIDARDPDLTATCKSGIAEIDAVANTVTPIATAVNKWMQDYIREAQADFAWNTYIGWKNGPDSGKLSADAFKVEAARQAKLACVEPGLALNSKDADADALKVLDYRQLDRSNVAAVDAFLSENLPADMNAWASALEANAGTGPEGFYKAIKVETTDWTAIVGQLQANLEQLTKAAQADLRDDGADSLADRRHSGQVSVRFEEPHYASVFRDWRLGASRDFGGGLRRPVPPNQSQHHGL